MRCLILLYLFLCCFLFALFGVNEAELVNISNVNPRLDVNGNIMDAHDGSIQKFTVGNSSLYYMHAMQYGLCEEPADNGCDSTPDSCGFQQDHNISIWSSPDLSSGSWSYVGNAINVSERPAGVVFRPHIVYNPNTKLYVLWWNYDNSVGDLLAVATSPSPAGPFTLQNKRVNVTQGGESGDYIIFVDDDGTGYVVYSMNYVMHIEQLTSDYFYSTGKAGPDFSEYFVEAPSMFKRNGTYYVLFGYCCCYCEQGSGVMVHTASHPMGPYTKISGDLACYTYNTTLPHALEDHISFGGTPTPKQGCQYANSNTTSVTRSQQNFIIEVDTPTGTEYIWTGDRWQQSPDGLKGHDPQYWAPLHFDDSGMLYDITWLSDFSMDVL